METQCLCLDRISTLPPSIIETILCFLPLKDAGRTSILSKTWRYRWTKIPKLVFDTFKVLSSKDLNYRPPTLEQTVGFERQAKWVMKKRRQFIQAVYKIMLLHHGPIRDLTISYYLDSFGSFGAYREIDKIIAHLLKHNALRILQLQFWCDLPVSIFSLCQLEDLSLLRCRISHVPTSNVFGSLTNLYLDNVEMSKKALMCILSHNQLLKSFSLFMEWYRLIIDDDSTIADLFKFLPAIDNLSICGISHFDEAAAVQQVLPTSLVHLKHLWIGRMCFAEHELPILFLLIRSSPWLETLQLELSDVGDYVHNWEDYSDIRLDHLDVLEIKQFNNLERELEFVKLILAKSPVLKTVIIDVMRYPQRVDVDEQVWMLTTLLRFPRASPFAEIIVN